MKRRKIQKLPVLRYLVSLKITVYCLLALFVLTFLGTIHQLNNGLYDAQKKYFQAFFTLIGGFLPLPGAQLVLWILFVNLLAATIYRFSYKIKRIGILIIHGGLFLMFIGMFFTQYFAQESVLSLLEGEGRNVSSDYFEWEIAFWRDGEQIRSVSAIDVRDLVNNNSAYIPSYNLKIELVKYYKNAEAFSSRGTDSGIWINGSNIDYLEEIRSSKDPQENSPGLLLKIETLDKSVSNILLYARDINPVLITFNGGRVFASLRRKQFVLPVVLTLEDFQAEFHPNSETPTSFESNVTIETSEFSRNALISMNNPLRFAGYTFYQASYAIDATGRETSTFAVVENRSRLVPYIGTAVIGIGLVIHFLQTLTYRKRQSVTRNDD